MAERNETSNGGRTAATSAGGQKGSPYTIEAVVRACAVLGCFQDKSRRLTLNEITSRCHIARPTAFRILTTLVECGMLEMPMKNSYCLAGPRLKSKRYLFGYASQSEEFSFSRLVSDSIRSSAYAAGVDLLVLNNDYSSKTAIRNVERFIQEGVDLVVEFQTDQHSAAMIASKLTEAGIPLIAIDIPHPGADYYGANNYRAGVIGGRALAHGCLQQWGGRFDQLVLLELPMAGPLPHSRLNGIVAGLRQGLPHVPDNKVCFLDGKGRFGSSLAAMRRHLARHKSNRVLLGAVNDPSCLGALQACEETGYAEHCLAVGQNGSIEAREEMRRPGSRLLGSVGYFPEQYGEAVVSLALDKAQGKQLPSATFVKHQMITPANVDAFYPNDKLMHVGGADSFLLSAH
jgi:ribose transport system substrate-binding protein